MTSRRCRWLAAALASVGMLAAGCGSAPAAELPAQPDVGGMEYVPQTPVFPAARGTDNLIPPCELFELSAVGAPSNITPTESFDQAQEYRVCNLTTPALAVTTRVDKQGSTMLFDELEKAQEEQGVAVEYDGFLPADVSQCLWIRLYGQEVMGGMACRMQMGVSVSMYFSDTPPTPEALASLMGRALGIAKVYYTEGYKLSA